MQFSALVALAVVAFAVATPTRRNEPASSCATGDLQCCQQTGSATDPAISAILASLGVNVQDVNALVGLTCSGVTVVGLGQGDCSANAVCCQDNSFGGVASIGCVPVSL